MLQEINVAPRILTNFTAIMPTTFKKDLESYLQSRSPVTFLSDLRSNLQVSVCVLLHLDSWDIFIPNEAQKITYQRKYEAKSTIVSLFFGLRNKIVLIFPQLSFLLSIVRSGRH